MFETFFASIASDNILSAILHVSEAFGCSPLEFLLTFTVMFGFVSLFIGVLFSFILNEVIEYAYRFSRWFFKALKAQYQKCKEKGR